MCFIEYIGYACGHSTIHVHRPCPLTTHIHTNPVCPRPAERPTQCHANCPSCARILHVRWVEIVTLEHQWMHERGVCGCEVVFPHLQQPRLVGEVSLGHGTDAKTSSNSDGSQSSSYGRSDGNSTSRQGEIAHDYDSAHGQAPSSAANFAPGGYSRDNMAAHHHGLQQQQQQQQQQHTLAQDSQGVGRIPGKKQKKRKARPRHEKSARPDSISGPKPQNPNLGGSGKPPKPHALAWDSTVSPMNEITQPAGPHSSKSKLPTTIAIRLSSQYGAEWIPQHAALHRAGKCKCAVVFETYKSPGLSAGDISEHAHPDFRIGRSTRALRKPCLRDSDIMVWRLNEMSTPEEQIKWPVQMQDFGFGSTAEAEAFQAAEVARSRASPSAAWLGQNQAPPPPPRIVPSRIATTPAQIRQTGQDPSHEYPLNTYDYRAIQEPLAGASTQSRTYNALALEPVKPTWHQQHDLPLVGWPLGAGPEGGDQNSHSPAWDMCILARPVLERCQSCPPNFKTDS